VCTPSGEEKHHPPSLDPDPQQSGLLFSEPATTELSRACSGSFPVEGNARLSKSKSKQDG